MGGSADDSAYDMAVDSSGAVFVTGSTTSSDFPTTPGAYETSFNAGFDVFVTKISPGGNSLAYSTYLGGLGNESGAARAIDSSGAAYLTGYTNYSDFPTTSGA